MPQRLKWSDHRKGSNASRPQEESEPGIECCRTLSLFPLILLFLVYLVLFSLIANLPSSHGEKYDLWQALSFTIHSFSEQGKNDWHSLVWNLKILGNVSNLISYVQGNGVIEEHDTELCEWSRGENIPRKREECHMSSS